MSTLELTLQHPRNGIYPLTAEFRQPGLLSLRREGEFALRPEALAELRQRELQPEAYGETLGRLLFRDDIRDLYMTARGDGDPLHLLLVVEAEELRPLRWERLALPDDGEWTAAALAQGVAFSRYLPSLSDRRFPLIGRRDLKLLAAVASPPEDNNFGLAAFNAGAVADGLRAALGDLPHEILQNASLDGIAEHLADGEYSLLHIVAHGWFNAKIGETALYFFNPDGGVEPVPAERLIKRLKALKRLPHLIFLSTCESAKAEAEGANALGGLAHRLVKQLGIPAVVAMGDKVSVVTANALAESFYRHLREHGQPDRALGEAAGPLAERGDILIPALYSRLGGRPLFSDSADRPLTPKEIEHGLTRLEQHLGERAPVLLDEFHGLRLDPAADPEHLGAEAREEYQEALKNLNALSEECLGIDFAGLALDKPPEPYDARCPFPGLYAFTAAEREFYFGREALGERLLQRLDEHPFLAVLGMSGSGKSSLVLAGIVPLLQQRRGDLEVLYLKPGNTPLAALESALNHGTNVDRISDSAIRELSDSTARETLLVIDQFEELFTLCHDPEQQRLFVERLMAVAKGLPRTPVILTLRSDFIGECAPFPALKDALQTRMELVAPMNGAELRGAMEQQAQHTGLRFEADLSHTILNEVENQPGAMPLLQHLLQELWKRRHGRWLKTEEYHRLGGIKHAIAHTADGFYKQLDKTEQEHCRNIFIRLTRLGEGEGDEHRDTRRRVSLDELVPAGSDAAHIKALAARLADTRLVMVSAEHIEVAHEALIQHWRRLRQWLNEDRFALSILDDLRRLAREWDEGERADNRLPRWSAKLEQAEDLVKTPRFGATALELAFLQACREFKEKEEREEAEKQRKLRQRFRWAVGVSVVALVTSGIAWLMYGEAEQQTIRAKQEQAKTEQQKNEALRTQSLFLADLARQQTEAGNAVNGMLLALEALPKEWDAEGQPLDRPYVIQAETALYTAVREQKERIVLNHQDGSTAIVYSHDSKWISSGDSNGIV